MLITIFVGGLLFFMLCGVPVAFAMGGTALISGIYLWGFEQIPINILAQRLLSGTNNFTTLAIPLFLLAGQLMNGSSITDRIFKFCQNLVGNVPGGLGQVNVLGSVIFSGMSGTAAADAAGIGSMEIKAMKDAGFDLPFSVAVTGASSLIGPIIPPSVPMVMYGVLAGVSVTGLFIGGILPGLIMALGMMVQVHIYSVKRNYPRGDKLNLKNLWESFKQAFFPLLTPVIIIGGIWSGVFTATEAAGVAVAYALVISLFVYRSISIKDTIALFKKSIVDCASILFVLGCVSMYGYVLTRTRLPEVLADGV
ncbi:MAG: siaM, partial [Clostridiales bacterium]|nr:siaM [Clostridiales bacterium]